MNKQFEHNVRTVKPTPLSKEESLAVWRATADALPAQTVRGPFYSLTYKPMFATIAAIVIVLVGGGATVAAADNARPGDALYGIDTATERVRLAIASEEKKSELKARFAAERAEEAEELIEEAEQEEKAQATITTSTDDGTEASTTTTDDADDNSDDANEQKQRAATATLNAITTLAGVQAELEAKGNTTAAAAIAETLARLEAKVQASNAIRTRIQVERDDDGEELRIEIEKRDRESYDDKEDDRDDDASSDDNQSLEIEVTVRGSVAYISYEMGDRKAEYRTTFTSREDIIAEIAADLNVSEDRVENYLKLKYEDDEDNDREDSKDDDSAYDDNEDFSSDTNRVKEIEVKVYGDQANAKVEMRSGKRTLQLSVTNRAEIIAALATELGVSESDVEAALKIERKDSDDDSIDDGDDRDEMNDDDSTIIDDVVDTLSIRKIEVETEDGMAKVEAKYTNGREKEFRIESGTEAEMDANIARELGISAESASALTIYKR